MSRLLFCNRLILGADGIKKVRYILDPSTIDEQSYYEDYETIPDRTPDDQIGFVLDCSSMGLTVAEAKATYAEIRAYVKEKFGVHVSSLYIAQIKRKYGLDMGIHYNVSKKENARVPKCPKEKEEYIMDALRHFRMLDASVELEVS